MGARTGCTNGPNISFDFKATEFMRKAACPSRPEIDFFSVRTSEMRRAQAVCAECPVRLECLDFAIRANVEIGVWGGMTRNQRKQHHRQLKVLAVAA